MRDELPKFDAWLLRELTYFSDSRESFPDFRPDRIAWIKKKNLR